MNKFVYFLLIICTCVSCGSQQKATNQTTTVNTSMIDSVNAQHDQPATENTLQNIQERDSTNFKKNPKFVSSKNLVQFSHNAWNELLQKHVSEEGLVDYAGMKEDHQKLLMYLYDLEENQPTDYWSREEKLAFWINAYNAMTVDLIVYSYPARQGIKEIRNPWKQRRWKIGEKAYNLDEIEHDILRKMNEPRIHFAINCASFSCPPLLNEAFTGEKLEAQLTNVTTAFIADTKRNTITKDRLEISKIFKWFAKDFKQNGSLIDFLNSYSDIKISDDADIDYKEYDWSLNKQ